MVKRDHAFLQDLLRHTFVINADSTCSKLAVFTKPELYFHNFLGTFTILVTVHYTNILRKNWTIFAFKERKRLLGRLISITVPVSEITISFLARKATKKKCLLDVVHLMFSLSYISQDKPSMTWKSGGGCT